MRTSRIIGLILGLIFINFVSIGQAGLFSSTAAPGHIALLLPLTGPYAESGKAIRDGFLAAFYESLPNDSNAPTIRIIDTTSGDIVTLYQRALEQGANIIVGPLSKEDGAKLVQGVALTVPTVILNTLSLPQPVANLYQFSLSPEDEVKQVAAKAWQDGKKNAIIIVPASAWGQRLAQDFTNEWQTLGGKTVGEMLYDDSGQLSDQVAQLLHVDQSEQRAKALQRVLMQPKMRIIPYRRQDVDMVFLVAKPELAREVRPLLGFYYAGKIPVYATSHLYSGAPDPQYDQDLNGVLFCAIPWEIAPGTLPVDLQTILHSIQQIWPQALQKQPQFFALGIDSYRLARQLTAGSLSTEMDGATGKLTLQPNRVWYRQLPWAQMVQGQPQLMTSK